MGAAAEAVDINLLLSERLQEFGVQEKECLRLCI